MARHFLKYGEQEWAVDIEPANLIAELEPNSVQLPALTAEQVIRQALSAPVQSPPLQEMVKAGERICLLVPDVTRSWQSPSVYVPIMVEELNRCGIPDRDITILSATGTHRRQTREEHVKLTGEDILQRIKVVDHQCREQQDMVYMGKTSHGTPVKFNRHAVEADKIVSCCGVVYHFLAGYGGGGKMLLPGIAAYDTIQHHHNLALNEGFGNGTNPMVCSGNLENSNVFQADLLEAAAMLPPCFSLNVVVNDQFNIISAFAGNWLAAHRAACRLVESIDGVAIPQTAPLVIASAGGYPKDINFYQTIKLLSNALAACSPKGTLILLSRCHEGFGDDDCQKQIQAFSNMAERERALRDAFSIGAYVGFLFAEAAETHNLILVTDMNPDNFARTGIRAVKTLDEALKVAAALNGGSLDMKTILMPHGASTLPKLKA